MFVRWLNSTSVSLFVDLFLVGSPLEDEGAYSDNDDDFSKSFDSSKQEMTEERRAKLREIEVNLNTAERRREDLNGIE